VWAALCGATGGIDSPFVAGFGIEIVLSGFSGHSRVPMMTTAAGIAGLWAQQAWAGSAGREIKLLISSGLLAALGVTVWFAVRSLQRAGASATREVDDLVRRLQAMQRELDGWKAVGKVGVHTARVTHGLKGSVESLRGLVGLVEARLGTPDRAAPALAGMRSALDHLDALVRSTLRSEHGTDAPGSSATLEEIRRAATEAADEVKAVWPRLTWTQALESDGSCRVPLSACTLKEILLVLFRNAAEAMNGEGCIEVRARGEEPDLELSVRDQGHGLTDGDLAHLFEPAFTTKPDGHGFGLYLARSLVTAAGGTLTAARAPRTGTVFTIRLPLRAQELLDADLAAAR
jgi:signal transduction histidine kinase